MSAATALSLVRTAGASLAGAVAGAGVWAMDRALSPLLADVPPPPDDPFYTADPGLARHRPGAVLESRAVTVRGFGATLRADAWQVRYRTVDTAGSPVAVVATVLLPTDRAATKLVSYQCAIDALGPAADPSYTLRRGSQREAALMRLALRRGWAVVTADYTGPRRSYGAGKLAGQCVLDGIRAALALPAANLGPNTPVALWGYSGGGQASSWAAELHPTYAPELNIALVAAGGVPADMLAAAARFDGSAFSGLSFGVLTGISREYPDLDLDVILNDKGRGALARIADARAEELVARLPFRRFTDLSVLARPLADPLVREVIARNDLGRAVPTAPMYLYHSVYDQLLPIATMDRLVAYYRAGGARVEYRRGRLGEHVVFAITGALGAVRAIDAAFAAAAADPVPVLAEHTS